MDTKVDKRKDGSWTKYVYSDAGLLQRLEDHAADDTLTMAVDYGYDDDGQNVSRIVRDEEGMQIRRLTFEYSPSGHCIYREYDANDNLQFTREVDAT